MLSVATKIGNAEVPIGQRRDDVIAATVGVPFATFEHGKAVEIGKAPAPDGDITRIGQRAAVRTMKFQRF